MPLEDLISVMRCPVCKGEALERRGDEVVCACGAKSQVQGEGVLVALPELGVSQDWVAKQDESVARYEHHSYEEDTTVAKLFGGFIAAAIDRNARVLDLGCSLTIDPPHYVSDLKLSRYIGLEPLTEQVYRRFACINGAVAEHVPLRSGTVDAVVMATSLDHVENADAGMAEIKRILAPGGKLLLWAGMYEPEMLAWSKPFWNLTHNGPMWKRALRFLAVHVEFTLLLWRMRERQRKLDGGIPLDSAHFRYHTRKSLAEDLARWGFRIERQILVPGAPSLFVEARPL